VVGGLGAKKLQHNRSTSTKRSGEHMTESSTSTTLQLKELFLPAGTSIVKASVLIVFKKDQEWYAEISGKLSGFIQNNQGKLLSGALAATRRWVHLQRTP
jgi:hypothetical protein